MKNIIVIDCQYDFINGSLACQNGEKAVDNIVKYIKDNPDLKVYYSGDCHPEDHCSFKPNGGEWPAHCVENTPGIEISRKFNVLNENTPTFYENVFVKGMDKTKEQYSAYEAKLLHRDVVLKDIIKDEIIVCGIATEFCVKNTIKDFVDNGVKVTVLKDCLGYVNKEEHEKVLNEFKTWGVNVI